MAISKMAASLLDQNNGIVNCHLPQRGTNPLGLVFRITHAKKTGCKTPTFAVTSIPFFIAAVGGNRMVLWVFFYIVNEIKSLCRQTEQKKEYLLFAEMQEQNRSSGGAKF